MIAPRPSPTVDPLPKSPTRRHRYISICRFSEAAARAFADYESRICKRYAAVVPGHEGLLLVVEWEEVRVGDVHDRFLHFLTGWNAGFTAALHQHQTGGE